MKKIIILAILLSACLYASSQVKWSLRQCIDYAIENNIEIKQQALKVESAKIDLNTSKNSRLPDLNANLNHRFSFGKSTNYSTGISEMNNRSGAQLSAESSVPLFTGFQIPNQIKADKLNLQAAVEGLNKVKDNMELQITNYYLEILFKKEILRAYQEQVELSQKQVEKTEILVNAGKVPLSQLYDIKAQLAKDELNTTTANNDLVLSILNLNQALNINNTENFDIVAPLTDNVIEDNIASILPPQQIYQTAITVKPHVKEAQYNVESSKRLLKVAQSGYYPTLKLGLGYGTSVQRIYGIDNLNFGKQFNDNGSEYINFTLSIPLFNRFQTRNQVRSARLQIYNNELTLDNVKLTLYKEIQQAYQSATAAQAKYNSTQKAHDAAAEAYKYAQEKYNIGKSTAYELNEAQTKLLTSKSEQIQAKYDFLFRAKILDFYSGKEINL